MGRKIRRVVNLNSKGIQNIPLPEIKVILRAADPLIMQGGRTLLAKMLKGSKDKDIVERNLNECPGYATSVIYP
jgi:hypothetical protein